MEYIDRFIAYGRLNALQVVCFWSVLIPLFSIGVCVANLFHCMYLMFSPFTLLLFFLLLWSKKIEYYLSVLYLIVWFAGAVMSYMNILMDSRLYIPMWLYFIFMGFGMVWIYLYGKNISKPEHMTANHYLIYCQLIRRIDNYIENCCSRNELKDYALYLKENYVSEIPEESLEVHGLGYYSNDYELIAQSAVIIIFLCKDKNKDLNRFLEVRNTLAVQSKKSTKRSKYDYHLN